MHKIFIVEDHPAMQQAYIDLVGSVPDLEVCGQASSAAEALDQIPHCQPDMILVDISLEEMNGIELVEQLQIRQPALSTLIVSGHEESFYARKALAAGAKGYVMKRNVRAISQAIRQVLAGEIYLSESMRKEILE